MAIEKYRQDLILKANYSFIDCTFCVPDFINRRRHVIIDMQQGY